MKKKRWEKKRKENSRTRTTGLDEDDDGEVMIWNKKKVMMDGILYSARTYWLVTYVIYGTRLMPCRMCNMLNGLFLCLFYSLLFVGLFIWIFVSQTSYVCYPDVLVCLSAATPPDCWRGCSNYVFGFARLPIFSVLASPQSTQSLPRRSTWCDVCEIRICCRLSSSFSAGLGATMWVLVSWIIIHMTLDKAGEWQTGDTGTYFSNLNNTSYVHGEYRR